MIQVNLKLWQNNLDRGQFMKFENIKYSKCPYCKKHGIYGILKIINPRKVFTCRFCGKKYTINSFLYYAMLIFVALFSGVFIMIFDKYILKIPDWLGYILSLAVLFLFEYFAPLEEYNEKNL